MVSVNPEAVKEKYNTSVADKTEGDYEYKRWFSSAVAQAGFDMTRRMILRHAFPNTATPERYLELGPGPGTWTKLFLKRYGDQTRYDLVDISREMLALARENLVAHTTVQFFESDFLDFEPDAQYDFFFSSRAIEYFPDKNALVKKVLAHLKKGGEGFMITKTPKYALNKMLGRKTSDFHSGQVDPYVLVQMLRENGGDDIRLYPVTFSFPLFRSATLNRMLFFLLSPFPLNLISQFFSESYCVKFRKK